MPVQIQHIFVCDICGERAVIPLDYIMFSIMTNPMPPPRWYVVGKNIYCNKHKVELYVDDDNKGSINGVIIE